MALPRFTLTGNLKEVLGDLSEAALTRATILLQSNIGNDRLVAWDDTAYVIQDAIGRVDTDGDVLGEDGGALVLLANDVDLSITGLQWRITITVPASIIPSLRNRQVKSWWIDAPGDGETIDLADVTPVSHLEDRTA